MKLDVRIGLGDYETAIGSNHHTLSGRASVRRLYGFEETARDAGRPLDTWSVIKISVVVGGAVLDPVAYSAKC